jgi:hypothetical protein
MSEPYEDDEDDLCTQLGHDDETVDEDEDGYTWRCNRCGAEGWEDNDDRHEPNREVLR